MYKMRDISKLRKSKSGQMPFALIAVTLLLLGSAYGVVYASIERSEETTENITNELMTISEGIEDTEKYIEAGIGNIIGKLSRKDSGGTLTDRLENFDHLVDDWIDQKFPLTDKGTTADITDYDIDIGVDTLKLSSGDRSTDVSQASYLKATGYAVVEYISSTGNTEKRMNIDADGISGLPFVVESATKFELSSSGGASALTELMIYQLSSLAQLRVMNGYGVLSEGGESGTTSIITEDDVKSSFRDSISIVEALCFRNTGDDDFSLITSNKVDAADISVAKDGYYEIDLSAIFAQTLMALADLLVLKWVDLLLGNFLIDAADTILDTLNEVKDGLSVFFGFKSKDDTSARGYIRSVMKNCGYQESSYKFPGTSIVVNVENPYENRFEMSPFIVSINTPDIDVLGLEGWSNFMNEYRGNTNEIKETMRNTLKTVALNISSGYGILTVNVNANDDVSFIDSLGTSLECALNDGWSKVSRNFEDTIRTDKIIDPLFTNLYDFLVENKNSIFKEDEFNNSIKSNIYDQIFKQTKDTKGAALAFSTTDSLVTLVEESGQIERIKDSYRDTVDEIMKIFEKVLTNTMKDNDSSFKNLLVWAGNKAMSELNLFPIVKENAYNMCQDMENNLEMNSRSGIIELDGKNSYELYDGEGNTHEEFVIVNDNLDIEKLIITTPKNNESKCYHTVGIDNVTMTPYTSVFTISFKAIVNYQVSSTSAVLRALGTYDATTNGDFTIDTIFDIPCVSGWALAGVSYTPTSNILLEIWNKLLEFLDPLLEPLREMFAIVKQLFDICSTAIIEISTYVTELIMKFYEAIEGPLENIQEFVEGTAMGVIAGIVKGLNFEAAGFDIGIATQTITLSMMGLNLTLEARLASLLKSTKTILKATIEGTIGDVKFSAFAEIKENQKNGYMFRGGGGVESTDWCIDLTIDPLMKFGKKLVSATGNIRGVDFEASIPDLMQYDEIEMRISNVPGVGAVLSNIPMPIPGMKGSIDMGVELKYNIPIKSGLMINEFETNPKGSDIGSEWVELYNASSKEINLSGYMIVPGTGDNKAIIITGEKIPPWGKTVITFDKQCLNNSKSGKYNGERLTLYDPEGNKVDETPWKKDSYNNDLTWQRSVDGSSSWEMLNGTPESRNGGTIKAGAFAKEFIIESLKQAGEEAFFKMGNHLKSIDDIAGFLEEMLRQFISNVIEKIADCIVSASVFIELEISDYAGASHTGLRIALEMNSDLVEDGLKWLLSQTGLLGKFVDGPSCTDPLNIVCDNTYFRTTVYTGIGAPKFLSNATGTTVTVGLSAGINISGICNIFGKDNGKWKANIGLVMEDLPSAMLPKTLKTDSSKHCDLWLLKMEFSEQT